MTLFDEIEKEEAYYEFGQLIGDWYRYLTEAAKADLRRSLAFVKKERLSGKIIYPDEFEVFRIFNIVIMKDIKVVILGQDPYFNGNANGLAFGCTTSVSPSLYQIIDSMRSVSRQHSIGNMELSHLPKQGVFLLNTILTVEHDKPESHALYWKEFTSCIIKSISTHRNNIVFMLWGNYAKQYLPLIDGSKHLVLTTTHPAAAARNNAMWRCSHFSETNLYLEQHNQQPIIWF